MGLLEEQSPTFSVTPFGLQFTVYGKAEPGGSKRALPKAGLKYPLTIGSARHLLGSINVVDDNSQAKDWKKNVRLIAAELMSARPGTFQGPLMLVATFYQERPKSHFGTRGLKPSAPKYPAVRPDVTKLLRPLEDALTGVVWDDDQQIVEQIARKRYGSPVRAEIRVATVL